MKLLKSPEIIYIVTRTHGLRTHLIKPDGISILSKSPDLLTVVETLLKGDYAEDVSAIPSENINAINLTKLFYKRLTDRFFFIVKITSHNLKKFFESYAKKLEVENLKRILRVKHGKEIITEEELIPIPREYTTINFPAIINARDLDESIALLKATAYSPLLDKMDLYKRYNTTLIFEGLLETLYYKQLWKDIEKFPEKNEIKDLIGQEMDLKNIILILGLKEKNLPTEQIEESIIKIHYKLNSPIISNLIHERSESTLNILMQTYYGKYFLDLRDLLEKNIISEIEHSIYNSIHKELLKIMQKKPLKLVFVLAYLLLCEFEAKNMTTIVTGKQLNLSEEELKGMLYL